MFQSRTEFQEFLNNIPEKVVIILFTASWCGPCKKAKPLIYQYIKQNPQYKYLEIDFDEHSQFAALMRVSSIPSMFGFVNGERESTCFSSNNLHITTFFDQIQNALNK